MHFYIFIIICCSIFSHISVSLTHKNHCIQKSLFISNRFPQGLVAVKGPCAEYEIQIVGSIGQGGKEFWGTF